MSAVAIFGMSIAIIASTIAAEIWWTATIPPNIVGETMNIGEAMLLIFVIWPLSGLGGAVIAVWLARIWTNRH
jgi:hypothetical protein